MLVHTCHSGAPEFAGSPTTLDTVLLAFTTDGNCEQLSPALANDDSPLCSSSASDFGSAVRIPVEEEQTVYFLLMGYSSWDFGTAVVSVELVAQTESVPEGDFKDCPSAFDLGTLPSEGDTLTSLGDLAQVSSVAVDPSHPCAYSNSERTWWYRATGSGHVLFVDVCESSFDTVLYVHASCDSASQGCLAVNDDSDYCETVSGNSYGSRTWFCADNGEEYFFAVRGYSSSDEGGFMLNVLASSECTSQVDDGVCSYNHGVVTADSSLVIDTSLAAPPSNLEFACDDFRLPYTALAAQQWAVVEFTAPTDNVFEVA